MAVTFDDLLEEATAVPIKGWDFSWLDGRAIEERPSWRYFDRVAVRAANASRMLEQQAGDGKMIATLPTLSALTVATEGYGPNVEEAGSAP